MKVVIHFMTQISKLRIPVLFIIIGTLALPLLAYASLGDDAATASDDLTRMRGVLRTINNETYSVHEIVASNGITVREYASSAGKIFAVAWQGQFFPDLQQLLGRYFDQFSQESKNRNISTVRIRGPLMIQQPGLVVQSNGHMRAYSGRAYIPDMVPQGMNIEEIK
jgi:hypothetical protein